MTPVQVRDARPEDAPAIERVARASWEDTYRDISHELRLEDWMRRPLAARYVDNVARLTATVQ